VGPADNPVPAGQSLPRSSGERIPPIWERILGVTAAQEVADRLPNRGPVSGLGQSSDGNGSLNRNLLLKSAAQAEALVGRYRRAAGSDAAGCRM
jgi:hypothetical protein